jgi:sulfatase maturation enzyme AslB (radical SAM superfamily)
MTTFPSIYTVEPVRGCNLRCPICAVGCGLSTRPVRHMSMDEFVIIADKISPYAEQLALHCWGEPMLNKNIFDMIAYARSFCNVGIHTNANCISDEDAVRLAKSGAFTSVSIDSMTQETYQIYRVGGKREKAMRVLKILVDNNPFGPTHVQAQMLVFAHNIHEVPAFIKMCKMCKDMGVNHCLKTPQVKMNPVLKPAPGYIRPQGSPTSCRDFIDVCTILADGAVVVCCYDYNAEVVFGNILTQSLEEVWASPVRKAYIDAFANGIPPNFCTGRCLSFA